MKKNTLLILMTLIAVVACDSPRTTRALTGNSSSGLNTNGSAIPVNLDNGSGSTTSTGSGTTTTTPTSTIPSDATQCKFATDGVTGFESTSSHLGDYTLCQSSSDKNVVYFQLKTPPVNSNGDISICLIPTTNNGSNSIYIGNPMCGYFKDPKAVRKITFIKYAAYSNAAITGVIAFKDLSWYYGYPFNNYVMTLDAYKTCMTMLAAPYYNSSYCTAFKNVNQYIYKSF
jgi:hypothetical protein